MKLLTYEKLNIFFNNLKNLFAAKTDLNSHKEDTSIHITSTERTNWNSAKTHAGSAHAPVDAQANVIESVEVNGVALTPTSKTIDITVPTKVSELVNDSGYKTIDNNTTYSLSKSGSTITLTGSDGSKASVTDSDTTYTLPTASSTTLGGVKIGTNVNISNGSISVASGSTSEKGIVQLTNSTSSTSTTTAATPSSVKSAYDRASTAITNAATAQSTADSKIGSVSIASGTNNGTIKLTVDDTTTDNIAVKGLGSAAYTASSAYATSAQGTKADNAMPKSGGTFTGSVTLNADPTANLGAATKQYVDSSLSTAKSYADTKVANLVGTAPETLDTLEEVAAAIEAHQDVTDALNSAIGNKVDKVSGKGLSTNDYTTTEKNKLSGIASGAEVNQNAFSNIAVGSTTVAADSKTDTLTLVAGSNVTITPDATNDKITISSTDTNTTYSAGTGLLLSGTKFNHSNSVTAGTAQGDADKTLTFGGTFTIPVVTYDGQGHITGKGTTTMTMPSNPNTHYASGTIVNNSTTATSNTTTALTNGNVYLNHIENGAVKNSHKISGSGATTVTTDASGNIIISSTDNNTVTTVSTTGSGNAVTGITASNGALTVTKGSSFLTAHPTISKSSDTTSTASPAHGGTFTAVDSITRDSNGHVTKINTKTITLPGDNNTDTKVTQSAVTASDYTNWRPVIFGSSNSSTEGFAPSTVTDSVFATSVFSVQPSTGTLKASTFKGALSGNASTATKATQDSAGQQINTTYIKALSVSGKTITYTKGDGTTGTITTQDTNTTYSNATTSANGLMSADDKSKLDGITASADSVSFSASLTSGTKVGTITINGTGTTLYAPTNTDTHYTTGLKVGASSSATANAAATNGNVYLNVLDNTTVRDSHKIVGSGATTVTSDANGVITISSTDTNTDTKNTAGSSNTSSKIYLIGATSQATNPQTYSHDTAYVGTNGCLYSGGNRVATEIISTSEPSGQTTGDFWMLAY